MNTDPFTIFKQYQLPTWEELPDFELYMDQVILLTTRVLAPIVPHFTLTPAMVNNYVKQKVMPAPLKKRYTKVHLSYLIRITLLKQILSLPEINAILSFSCKKESEQDCYMFFVHLQQQSFAQVSGTLKQGIKQEQTEACFLLQNIVLSLTYKLYGQHQFVLLSQKSKEED